MKLVIEKSLLEENLSKLVRLSTTKNVSKCLLIACDKKKLLLSTNNDESLVAYVKIIPSEIINTGNIVIDARKFDSLIKKLPDSDLTIISPEVKKNKTLTISNDKGNYVFEAEDEQFPIPGSENYFWTITLNAEVLLGMLKKSAWAYAAKDEERRVLEKVLLRFVKNEFCVASGDSKKFCYSYTIAETDFEGHEELLLPNKLIKTLLLQLQSATEVLISIGEEYAKIACDDGINYVCKLYKESKFPNIEKLSSIDKYQMVIDRMEFKKVLARLTGFIDNIKSMIIFEFKKSKNVKLLSFNISDKNQSDEILSTIWESNNFKVGFNGKVMADVLTHTPGIKKINVFMDGPLKPFKICTEGNSKDFYLLQSLRTD